MADKHPYTSGSSGLTQAVNQFRKAFPQQISSETLKRLGIAPNNETYVINIFRFIGLLDKDGKKTKEAAAAFSKHDDVEFAQELSALVQKSYSALFELHGNDAWSLQAAKLISFFRNTDQTSAIVGQRQASTFQTLATLSGHEAVNTSKPQTAPRASDRKSSTAPKVHKRIKESGLEEAPGLSLANEHSGRQVGLTVRIEINLPVASDQETYDRIFKSIKENLING